MLHQVESQGEVNASHRRTVNDLAAAQERADERLNQPADVVERHIVEGRNGHSYTKLQDKERM
jgi:hypothetical protein